MADTVVERRGDWQLRRWCPRNQTHQEAGNAICDWWNDSSNHGSHRLRKRWMVICSECQQGYFTQEGFDEHECYSAY